MKARQLIGALGVTAFFLQANEVLWADNYTVAYDTVQATSFLALSNGFNGSRVTVAQVESGASPETNQVAFSNVHYTFHQNDPGGAHATAVGSILLGRAPGFSGGVATGVTNAEFWDANNFISEVIVSNVTISSKVVNQSFTTLSTNALLDAYYDFYIDHQNVIIVSGASGSAGLVNSPGSFHNGITVGASDAFGNPSGGPVGPTFDGRSKPDLIAPISAQIAASPSVVSNNFTFTNSYAGIEGTSLATPFVAGAAAILVDKAMGTPALSNATDARVVKSILMASAKKMSGWHRGTNDDASTPLDFTQGAGLLQISNAYAVLTAGQQSTGGVANAGWDFTSMTQSQVFHYDLTLTNNVQNPFYELTASLNWNFHPVTTTSNLFRNLNLQVWSVTNGVEAQRLQISTSVVDNLQYVYLNGLTSGNYRLEVDSVSWNAPGAEAYAFSWQAVAIPEPSTLVLLLVTGVPLLLASRRFLESAR